MSTGSALKADPGDEFVPDAAAFQTNGVAFLKQNCLRCHGEELSEGDFRVDTDVGPAFDDLTTRGKWDEVVNVLNSHEMPPEDEPQPSADEVKSFVDWVTDELIRADKLRHDSAIVLRRMNRDEYRNTIRDLVGVDYSTKHFPQDPPTGGFDNNGAALTISPMHIELYLNAARDILDEAIVDGEKPPMVRWRFEPESGNSDSNRVEYDGQRLIVNAGQNRVEGGHIVMHHASWDRTFNVRDFALKDGGKYIVRVRAGGRIPTRDQVIESAKVFLEKNLEEARRTQPDQMKWKIQESEKSLEHFQTFRSYDYGPPRLKVIQHLAGQPRVIAEFDVEGSLDEMQTIEFETDFTTDNAGLTIEYAYDIPKEVENFWLLEKDEFARPEAVVDWMELEGPIYPQWPPASHRRLLFDSPKRDRNEREYAREVITRFMQRAYRRRVSEVEIEQKLALYDAARKDADTLEQAIASPLTAILVSPSFLYLAEPSPSDATTNQQPIDDFQLASRMSYFLWGSMPDDELFRLASQQKLHEPQVRAAQVNRMLADPKSEAFITNFAGQWLGLRDVGANPPAADLYRRYDRHLEISIVSESLGMFREVLQNDLSVMNFIDSDFVMINERLARFYGIDGVRGDTLRRVAIPGDVHRGGVLTQASMLSTTSNGTRTSPVKRGVWILKNILGTDPGLPVANAGEIAPQVPGIDKATVRQRLEIHRQLPQCARCHNKIDPLGFALENFDASGEWRDREGHGYQGRIEASDPIIDASSKLPDGTEIDGIESLKNALMKNQEPFLRCLSEKMFTFALGREMSIVDRPQIQGAVDHLQQNDLTLRSLIQYLVASSAFNQK